MTLYVAGDNFKGYCPVCGLPLNIDGACLKYHIKKAPKRKRYSGKSKSPNRWNNA